MPVTVTESLRGLALSERNALADASADWLWLVGLEATVSTGPGTGWTPCHVVARDPAGGLLGVCPAYACAHGDPLPGHALPSPRLVACVPFAPAAGPRLYVAPAADRAAVVAALAEGLLSAGPASVHVELCREREARALAGLGFLRRFGLHYCWRNPGFADLGGWLASLRHEPRRRVLRARATVASAGVEVAVCAGEAIPDGLLAACHPLYAACLGGAPGLTPAFFGWLAASLRDRLVVVTARRAGRLLAFALDVLRGDTLSGCLWGTAGEVPGLHAEVCHHAAVEWCLAHGVRRFEAGAGGDLKRKLGFDAVPTFCAVHVADPELATATARYLGWERAAVAERATRLRQRSGRKRRGA